jgi:hypothetical protein
MRGYIRGAALVQPACAPARAYGSPECSCSAEAVARGCQGLGLRGGRVRHQCRCFLRRCRDLGGTGKAISTLWQLLPAEHQASSNGASAQVPKTSHATPSTPRCSQRWSWRGATGRRRAAPAGCAASGALHASSSVKRRAKHVSARARSIHAMAPSRAIALLGPCHRGMLGGSREASGGENCRPDLAAFAFVPGNKTGKGRTFTWVAVLQNKEATAKSHMSPQRVPSPLPSITVPPVASSGAR